MNDLLFESVADYSAPCKWCIQNCSEKDKYEMLVTCIKIQNEFVLIIRKINLLLGERAGRFIEQIIIRLEQQIEYMLGCVTEVKEEPNLVNSSNKAWKLPGCSQIFNIAQSISHSYSSKRLNSD
jgi:hypothetical protein